MFNNDFLPKTGKQPFMDLKLAHSIEGAVIYIQKEGNPTYVNMRPIVIKTTEKWTQVKVIPLTVKTFPHCYALFIKDTSFTSPYFPSTREYYKELYAAMKDYGFDVSFMMKNFKYCYTMVQMHHDTHQIDEIIDRQIEQLTKTL